MYSELVIFILFTLSFGIRKLHFNLLYTTSLVLLTLLDRPLFDIYDLLTHIHVT